MKNSSGTQVRARPVALDLIAFVMRAAGVGLCAALVLAGVALLFSSQAEAVDAESQLGPVPTARDTTSGSIPPLRPTFHAPPLARLSVPHLAIEREVLPSAGSARSQTGARHMAGTALPAEAGNSVIGDHCDMQLAFLRELTIGTEILVEAHAGIQRRYVVRYTQFLDRADVWVLKQEGPTRLTLITCSPADVQNPSRLQRYAVSAYALDDADAGAERADQTHTRSGSLDL